ncbi:hypothetical protein Droror1_Dr00025309 [Drosera rotundifolia]
MEAKVTNRIKNEVYWLQGIYGKNKKVAWVSDSVELQIKAKWASRLWRTKAQRAQQNNSKGKEIEEESYPH